MKHGLNGKSFAEVNNHITDLVTDTFDPLTAEVTRRRVCGVIRHVTDLGEDEHESECQKMNGPPLGLPVPSL